MNKAGGGGGKVGGRRERMGWVGCMSPLAAVAAAIAGSREIVLGGWRAGSRGGRTDIEGGGRRRKGIVLLMVDEGETVMGQVMVVVTAIDAVEEELVLEELPLVAAETTDTGETWYVTEKRYTCACEYAPTVRLAHACTRYSHSLQQAMTVTCCCHGSFLHQLLPCLHVQPQILPSSPCFHHQP